MTNTYFINLWVTLRCNFRCRYCYVKPIYEDIDLTMDTADKIIEFIKTNKKDEQDLIVNFHGGEPLLNFDIIKYFIKRCDSEFGNVSYGITTNGYLITDEIVEFMAKKFNFNLSVSIDGMEETHNFNRTSLDGKNTHKIILENAKKLLKYNSNIRIRMTYDRYNIKFLYVNFKYFVEQGFKLIVPIQDSYSKEWKDEDFVEIKNQYRKIRKFLEKNNLSEIKPRILEEEFCPINKCDANDCHMSIDVRGNIYPCTNVVGKSECIIGNVFNGIDKENLKKAKQITSKKIEECKECALYDYCMAVRCVFINYAVNGDYFKPDLVECNMMNLKLELLKETFNNSKGIKILEKRVEE